MICPYCKNEVPKAKYCKNCGAYIENEHNNNECEKCGFKVLPDASFCPNCGNTIVKKTNSKSMLVTIILSIFLPGFGQIYLGLTKKGLIFLISYIISAFLILIYIGFVLLLIIWVWSLIDSIQSCAKINKGEFLEDKLL